VIKSATLWRRLGGEYDPLTGKIRIIEPKSEKQKIAEKEFEEEWKQLEEQHQRNS